MIYLRRTGFLFVPFFFFGCLFLGLDDLCSTLGFEPPKGRFFETPTTRREPRRLSVGKLEFFYRIFRWSGLQQSLGFLAFCHHFFGRRCMEHV